MGHKAFSLSIKVVILFFIHLLFIENFSFAQVSNKVDTASLKKADTIIRHNIDLSIHSDTISSKPKESSTWWDNLWYDLSVEIVGGLLYTSVGALLTLVSVYFIRRRRKWKFKQIFGKDINAYTLVYPSLTLQTVYDYQGHLLHYPYIKGTGNFKMSQPVSLADLRAAIYLSDLFFKIMSKSPQLVPDTQVQSKLDFSYTAIGGLSNDKTNDVLIDSANNFYKFNLGNGVTIKRIKDAKLFNNNNIEDLGIIIKIKSSHFPNRTQICIAGLGEYGTSGAAWYLANKWKEIRKKVKGNNFGAVIKVRIGKDESATLLDICS